MTKKEFLSKLRRKICRLPHKEISERLGFYNEIIDDKIEEGIPEKEAVAGVGNIEDIAAQILSDANVELKNQKKGYKSLADHSFDSRITYMATDIDLCFSSSMVGNNCTLGCGNPIYDNRIYCKVSRDSVCCII